MPKKKAKTELRPLKGGVRERRFLVFDLESKDGDSQKGGFTRPFLAACYDGRSYVSWYGEHCLRSALGFILRPEYSGHYIYAHYGGGFDYLHFLPLLLELPGTFEVELVPVASTIQAIRVTRGRYKWTFLDSFKLIPTKLEDAAKTFKVEHLKEEGFDYDTHETDPSWERYLKADCFALYAVLERFHAIIEQELGGEVGVTLASTSMLTFRRGYLRTAIQRCKEHHAFVREGYYGGNTQMFVREARGLRCYDINSSYPYAMLGPVPVSHHRSYRGKPSRQFLETTIGFVRANVQWAAHPYPNLPHRSPQGKLLYPIGEFSGVWCHEELLLAESMGAEVEWREGEWFNASDVLADYMRELYAYRVPTRPDFDEGVAKVAKDLGNSCYGKFGQNPERQLIVLRSDEEDFPDGCIAANDDDDCRVFFKPQVSDADYIIPQIAATITARARCNLQGYINRAHAMGGIVAYCDTDSIMTTADLSAFVGPELGQLKDEGHGHTYRGKFVQPKLYCLTDEQTGEDKVRMKGFRYADKRRADRALFDRATSGERYDEELKRTVLGDTIVTEELEKLGALAAAGFKRGPLKREVKKTILNWDTKRVWLPDGTSLPPTLSIDDE